MQHLQKTRGSILQARYFSLSTSRRLSPHLPSSVHSSKFRIPQTLYFPFLRKHWGCTGIFPILEFRPRHQSLHAAVCYYRRCCLRFGRESEPGMTARILDGTKIRDQIFAELKDEVRLLTAAGVRPGLAAVLVGENPASQMYVKSKIAACEEVGLSSALITPPATVGTLEMLAVVDDLNRDNNVDGILIQLPLPSQVDTKRILEAVDPSKDVHGFHPVNFGEAGSPAFVL